MVLDVFPQKGLDRCAIFRIGLQWRCIGIDAAL